MMNAPEFYLVAQGSVTTPKLDIALWSSDTTKAAHEMAATLHKAGYFLFSVYKADGTMVLSLTVEQPEVIVTSKIWGV